MPFSEQAIDKSVVKVLKEKVELPYFEDGYQAWRQAFDAGMQVTLLGTQLKPRARVFTGGKFHLRQV